MSVWLCVCVCVLFFSVNRIGRLRPIHFTLSTPDVCEGPGERAHSMLAYMQRSCGVLRAYVTANAPTAIEDVARRLISPSSRYAALRSPAGILCTAATRLGGMLLLGQSFVVCAVACDVIYVYMYMLRQQLCGPVAVWKIENLYHRNTIRPPCYTIRTFTHEHISQRPASIWRSTRARNQSARRAVYKLHASRMYWFTARARTRAAAVASMHQMRQPPALLV